MGIVAEIKSIADVLGLAEKLAAGNPVEIKVSGSVQIQAMVAGETLIDTIVHINEER